MHFCLMCSVRYTGFSSISRTRQRTGNRNGFPVPIYQSMHFSSVQPILSCESRFSESRLEAIVNSINILSVTSPSSIGSQEMLFLCLSFAVPSTTRSLLFDDVVRD